MSVNTESIHLNAQSALKDIVNINHIYIVAGSTIYQSFTKDFIKTEFANTEIKHIKSTDRGEWQGIYLRGINTYIEIFDNFNNLPLGSVGIGFGVEKLGELEKVYAQINDKFSNLCIREFKLVNDQYTHFQYIEFPAYGADPVLNSFIIGYTPETFKNQRFIEQSGFDDRDVSRARFNQIAIKHKRMFKDITAIELAIRHKDVKQKFINLLNLLGFTQAPKLANNSILFTNSGYTIKLCEPEENANIGVTLHTSLLDSYDPVRVELDNNHSALEINNDQAIIKLV
ncbi:MAG: hypothetical protein Tsb005_12060 [Gammaproteobacteria bacterium]